MFVSKKYFSTYFLQFNLFLYYHADVNSFNKMRKTPFDLACENGQEKVWDANVFINQNSFQMLECMFNCAINNSFFGSTYPTSSVAFHLAAANGHLNVRLGMHKV